MRNNFVLNYLSIIVEAFINKALKYRASFNLKIENFMCC